MPASHHDSYIAIAQTPTPGTKVGSFFLEAATESLGDGESIGRVRVEPRFSGLVPRESYVGTIDVAGNIAIPVVKGRDLEELFYFALGGVVSTGTEPYTHTITRRSRFNSTFAALPASITIGRGTASVTEYTGCQCNQLTFKGDANSHAFSLDTTWMAQSYQPSPALTPSYPSIPLPLLWRELEILVNGSPLTTPTSLSLSVSNGIQQHRGANQSSFPSHFDRDVVPPSMLELTFPLESNSYHVEARTGAKNSVTLRFSRPNGEIMEIQLPRLETISATGSLGGSGRVQQTIRGEALFDATAGHDIAFVTSNSTRTSV